MKWKRFQFLIENIFLLRFAVNRRALKGADEVGHLVAAENWERTGSGAYMGGSRLQAGILSVLRSTVCRKNAGAKIGLYIASSTSTHS